MPFPAMRTARLRKVQSESGLSGRGSCAQGQGQGQRQRQGQQQWVRAYATGGTGSEHLCAFAGAADKVVKDAGTTLRPVLVAPDVKADERGLARLKQVHRRDPLAQRRLHVRRYSLRGRACNGLALILIPQRSTPPLTGNLPCP